MIQKPCGCDLPRNKCKKIDELFTNNQHNYQDQIENLKNKILLKERYNTALKEVYEENQLGKNLVLADLIKETNDLRFALVDALKSEKTAVQNVFKTHREFQLAMNDKTPECAIVWLEDKIFDVMKKFNGVLFELALERKKLEDTEAFVLEIEKWPKPGSLNWESKFLEKYWELEKEIDNVKVKKETVTIMHQKYNEIYKILSNEKAKYDPIICKLRDQLDSLKEEGLSLEKMYNDALKFLDLTEKNLVIIEKYAGENKRKRKKQIILIKREVEKILDHNEISFAIKLQSPEKNEALIPQRYALLKRRSRALEDFKDKIQPLVQAFDVQDITLVPYKIKSLNFFDKQLGKEIESKCELRNKLIRQKNQLYIVLCHFQFSGAEKRQIYLNKKQRIEDGIKRKEKKIESINRDIADNGDTIVSVRMSVISILEILEDKKKKQIMFHSNSDLKEQLNSIEGKLNMLVSRVDELKGLLSEKKPIKDRNYGNYIKDPPIPSRLVRVAAEVSDDEEEDIQHNFRVPTNASIKMRSSKVINQALIKGTPKQTL